MQEYIYRTTIFYYMFYVHIILSLNSYGILMKTKSKLYKQLILGGLLIAVINPLRADDYNAAFILLVGLVAGTAAAIGVAGGVAGYWLRGKNNESERLKRETEHLQAIAVHESIKHKTLEHERVNQEQAQRILLEKQQQEKQKQQEDAKNFLQNNRRFFAEELTTLQQGRELSKERLEELALSFADKGFDYHVVCAAQLRRYYDQCIFLVSVALSEDDRKDVESLAIFFKTMHEKFNYYFKDIVIKEVDERKNGESAQKMFDLQIAIKKEELAAKQIETKSLAVAAKSLENVGNAVEVLASQAQHSIQDVRSEAVTTIRNFDVRAQELYAANTANYRELLRKVRAELSNHGFNNQRLERLEANIFAIANNQKNNNGAKIKEDMEALLAYLVQINQTQQEMKNNGSNDEIKKQLMQLREDFNKKFDAVEATLANMAAKD